jgi:hypothetical protein
MKKILEVTLIGRGEVKFSTDFNAETEASQLPGIIYDALWSMVTDLWGGNEASVLAMIRALSVADLAASTNRSQMIKFLDEESRVLSNILHKTMSDMDKRGIGQTFAPGVPRPDVVSRSDIS